MDGLERERESGSKMDERGIVLWGPPHPWSPSCPPPRQWGISPPPPPLSSFSIPLIFSRPTCEACGETDEGSINAAMPRVPYLRSRRSSGEKIPFSFFPPPRLQFCAPPAASSLFLAPLSPFSSSNLITNGVTALNNPAAPKKKRKKGYQGTFALPSSSIFSFFEGGSPPLHPSRQ